MKQSFPLIETERLILREFRAGDAEKILEIYNDWEVVKYYGLPFVSNMKEAGAEVSWFIDLFRSEKGMRWCITEKGSDIYIGDIGYYDWEPENFRSEFGFKLARNYWRKGFLSEIMPSVLNYGFEKMNLNRIQAIVDLRNEPSWKMLEKFGFTREGILREYEFEHGGFVYVYMYSLLKQEFGGKPVTGPE